MHNKLRLAIGTMGVLALALTACGGPAAGDGPAAAGNSSSAKDGVTATSVSVGTISDETGPAASVLLPWLHGIDAVVQSVNKSGGISGRTINLISEDDKFDVTLGLPAYKKLATQTPVVSILGITSSNVQNAVQPLAEAAKIPVLFGTQTKATLDAAGKYSFGIGPNYADQADIVVAASQKRLGTDKFSVVVVHNGSASGKEMAGLIKTRSVNGISDLGEVVLPLSSTTADAQMQQIISLKPDVIIVHGASGMANALLRAEQKFGASIPITGITAAGGPEAYQGLPPAVGNLLQYATWVIPSPNETAGLKQMQKDSDAAGYGSEAANADYVTGYVAGLLLKAALEKAGADLTRESFTRAVEQISKLDTGGLSSPIGYSQTDHAGAQVMVPLAWDYKTGSVVPQGSFDEYASKISGQYVK